MSITVLEGTVWTGRELLSRGRVALEGDAICRVEEIHPGAPRARSAEVPLISPPFVDSHVHLRTAEEAEAAAAAGVFWLRDMGSRGRAALSLHLPGVASAGAALCPAKGYGGFLGVRVRDLAEAEVHLRGLRESGASFVKLIGSGIVDFREYGRVGAGGFAEDELAGIIDMAGGLGLPAAVHANGDEAVRAAARAGAASIEHGFFIGPETLRVLADRGVFWCPTVYAVAARIGKGGGDQEVLAEICRRHLERVGEAVAEGVRLAMGTDAGSPGVNFGGSLLHEMGLWSGAGVSWESILDAATAAGAELGRRPPHRLRPGEKADLVVLDRGDRAGGSVSVVRVYRNGEVRKAREPRSGAVPSP